MFWKKRDPQWEKGIKQLKGYRKLHGDANVPIPTSAVTTSG